MPKKILIVEDNLDMRELLHLYLKSDGFTIVTAGDGREGLYMARAEDPDLILTDIHMPDLDGIEMVKQLRTQKKFKETPIIVLTAFGHEERDRAIRAGANRAVDKPTDLESLVNDVNELLELQRDE